MRLQPNILDILSSCRVAGQNVFLPEGQLARPIYEQVNKALIAIGGKWNRSAKAHVFDDDPAERLDQVVLTGEAVSIKQTFQFFETGPNLALTMAQTSRPDPGHHVLEPSAGRGALIKAILDWQPLCLVHAVELEPGNVKELQHLQSRVPNLGFSLLARGDFMSYEHPLMGPYDRVIMNPPFTRQQDVDHVTRAWGMLRPGGRLVAITSESPFFRTNAKSMQFRALVDQFGSAMPLPEGTFKGSGTMVNTRFVVLDKP